MPQKIKFIMVGGFLGAGKTTALKRLASHYIRLGKKVALVTNDQADHLVDTETLRADGFHVGEVPGACFCCNFNDLVSTMESLSEKSVPDLIIAEPVGSCTDLIATVVYPMRELFGEQFEVGSLLVLLKPEHGQRILLNEKRRGFSPKAEYIFLKQLEEADTIFVNKIDKLTDEQQSALIQQMNTRFPHTKCHLLSLRNETGMEAFFDAAEAVPRNRIDQLEMDYVRYGEGEAELGWMNCQLFVDHSEKFSLDQLVLDCTKSVGEHIANANGEVAHLKVLGQTMQSTAIANLVSRDEPAELSLASEVFVKSATLLVNARAAIDPALIETAIKATCVELSVANGFNLQIGELQSFRPSQPTPTHRHRET